MGELARFADHEPETTAPVGQIIHDIMTAVEKGSFVLPTEKLQRGDTDAALADAAPRSG